MPSQDSTAFIPMGHFLRGFLAVTMVVVPLIASKTHSSLRDKHVFKHHSPPKEHSAVERTSDLPRDDEYGPPSQIEGTIGRGTEVSELKRRLATALEELQIMRREHAVTRAQNIELMEDLRCKREEVLVARAEAQCAKEICMLSLSEAKREHQTVGPFKVTRDEATIVAPGLQSRVALQEGKESPQESQDIEDISPWFVNSRSDNRDCMPGPLMREVIDQKEHRIAALNEKLSECYNQLQLSISQNSSRGTVLLHASEHSYFDPYENVEEWKKKSYSAPPSTSGRPGTP